jgi:hypothetical protein
MAFLPTLTRLALGRRPFGDTREANVILGLAVPGLVVGFFPMLIYVTLPSFDYINRYRAVQFMCSLMDEGVALTPCDEEEATAGDANGSAVNPCVAEAERLALILDMRQSQNVLAWSLVRRSVAHSGEFGHSFYLKFQAYSLIMFGSSCLFTGGMAFDSRATGTIDLVAFVHVFARISILVFCVLAQVYFGYKTNRMAPTQKVLTLYNSNAWAIPQSSARF